MSGDQYNRLLDVAGPVSRETLESLKAFEALFLQWAVRINLAAPSTLNDVWERHILDSAQLGGIAPEATNWLDLGSGGGFPGLIVAFLMKDRGAGHIDLVDSNRKKTAFLQTCVGKFSLPAKVYGRRIDGDLSHLKQPEIVTARALAALPVLLELASPWLTKGASGLFHKGRDYRSELQESADMWRFDLVEHPSKIDPESVILEIKSLERRRA